MHNMLWSTNLITVAIRCLKSKWVGGSRRKTQCFTHPHNKNHVQWDLEILQAKNKEQGVWPLLTNSFLGHFFIQNRLKHLVPVGIQECRMFFPFDLSFRVETNNWALPREWHTYNETVGMAAIWNWETSAFSWSVTHSMTVLEKMVLSNCVILF